MSFPTKIVEDEETGELKVYIDDMIFVAFDNPIDANGFKNIIDPYLKEAVGIGFAGTLGETGN